MIKNGKSSLFYPLFFILLMSCGSGDEKSTVASAGGTPPLKEVFTPVTLDVYEYTPPFFGSDNKYHLIYGLLLTNTRSLPAELKKVEVFDSNDRSKPLLSLEGDKLLSFLLHLDSHKAENTTLEGDVSRMLFLSLEFENTQSIPRNIFHHVELTGASGPGSKEPSLLSYDSEPLQVSQGNLPVISPPLKGKGWVAINGCCSFNGVHQTTMLPINGELYNSQRFATDYMKLDDQGRFVSGDASVPANWNGYNEKVFAVADGTVVSILNDLPDQPPGTLPDPQTINVSNYTGNHIILKIREDVYVFYAHLRKGSVRVKVGERVKAGDHVADLGNSGNTSAPHLHIHLTSMEFPAGSPPVPYSFDTFTYVGFIDPERFYGEEENLEDPFEINASGSPELRKQQYPLDMTVVEF